MKRVALFVDAGYFWVQAVSLAHPNLRRYREDVTVNYDLMRLELLGMLEQVIKEHDLLRVYWYDGPTREGGKSASHVQIENLDNFKLRLGMLNGVGQQKAVDGFIITDMINLAQNRAISDAVLISGDADLLPGVIAAQNLGLRVALVSMGSLNATSPVLKSEVDVNRHWEEASILKFVTPVEQRAGATAEVAVVTIPPVIVPPTFLAGATSAADPSVAGQTPTVTATVGLNIAAIVTSFIATMDSGQKAAAISGLLIPNEIDKRLLRTAVQSAKRQLQEGEKRQVRAALRLAVKSAPPAA